MSRKKTIDNTRFAPAFFEGETRHILHKYNLNMIAHFTLDLIK